MVNIWITLHDPLLHPSFPGDSEGDMAKAGGEWPRCEKSRNSAGDFRMVALSRSQHESDSLRIHATPGKKTKRIDPQNRMVLYCSTVILIFLFRPSNLNLLFFPGKTAAFSRLIWGSLTRGGHHGVASRTVTAPQHDNMTRIVFCFALVLLLQFSAGVGQRNNKLTKFVSVYFVLVCIPANSTFIHWSDML